MDNNKLEQSVSDIERGFMDFVGAVGGEPIEELGFRMKFDVAEVIISPEDYDEQGEYIGGLKPIPSTKDVTLIFEIVARLPNPMPVTSDTIEWLRAKMDNQV